MNGTAKSHDSRAAAPIPRGDGAAARSMRDSPRIRLVGAIALDVLGSSRRSDPATHVKDGHVPEIHRFAERADELQAAGGLHALPSPAGVLLAALISARIDYNINITLTVTTSRAAIPFST